jgi:dUTP pyrophosphatase
VGLGITVKVKKLKPDAALPEYETPGAAGMDIKACLDGDATIPPGGRLAVPTGLAFEIPASYEAQVRPRSGLAKKYGVTILNSPGTIDSDYRGEVSIILVNLGAEPWTVRHGDRIAQLVFAPLTQAALEETARLSDTERGSGGFGSTGL